MITVKTQEDIQKMRQAGRILAVVLNKIIKQIKPRTNLLELESLAEKLIKKYQAEPSFKGHKNYPACLCLSVNEEVVHCPPKQRILQEGDIISIDCGLKYKGVYVDMARTIPVGQISPEAAKLVRTTQEALDLVEKSLKPGMTVGAIGSLIQTHVEKAGFNVVRALVGHGVGYDVHEEPRIPNYGQPGEGPILKEGMCLAIEPMVNAGKSEVEFAPDGWRVTTKDKSLSAHFEDTIILTKTGCEVVTR